MPCFSTVVWVRGRHPACKIFGRLSKHLA